MFTQMKKRMGVLFLAMLAMITLPIMASAEEMELDPTIASLSAIAQSTEVGATTDYDFTMTTSNSLSAGSTIYLMFIIQSDIQLTEIGTSFENATFITTDSISASVSTSSDHNHAIAILGLTEELAAGEYNFILEDVVNPNDDYTIYPSVTTAEPGPDSAYTMANPINIGEGSEGSEENESEPGPTCEEDVDQEVIPEIENISLTAIGEHIRVRWDAQEDSNTYVVNITEDENYQDMQTLQTGIEDLMYEISDVNPETTYYIDIRGDDENNCMSAHGQASVTTGTALSETRAKKAEFSFPKKKVKKKKFNVKFAVEDPEEVFRVEYQVFKGKKAVKAKRIFKKKRYKKTKKKLKAVTVKGKKIEPGKYYHVRMRKVYKINDELVRTKYSKKKRVRTKKAVVEATM